jgi:hypothetical protein
MALESDITDKELDLPVANHRYIVKRVVERMKRMYPVVAELENEIVEWATVCA